MGESEQDDLRNRMKWDGRVERPEDWEAKCIVEKCVKRTLSQEALYELKI